MKKIICGDLGGTKCTAGVVEFDPSTHELNCTQRFTLKLADTHSLENLISQLAAGLDFDFSAADAICFGAAGQYDGETLQLAENYPYSMHFATLAKQQNWPTYAIVHDYTPVVCATFTNYMHAADNLKRLNAVTPQPFSRRVALGLGTGVGLKDGILLPTGDFWLGTNEIGHIGINHPPQATAQQTARHQELLKFLHARQPITYEKILSGQGLVNLFQFLYPTHEKLTAAQIGLRMQQDKAPELLEMFAWYLGLFIGTVQLIFMPEGGIWITGGVALHHLALFEHAEFFAGVAASPAYFAQRQQYPLGILCNTDHALLGGAYYAAKRLLTSYA